MSRYLISYPNNCTQQYCGENKSVISKERCFLARTWIATRRLQYVHIPLAKRISSWLSRISMNRKAYIVGMAHTRKHYFALYNATGARLECIGAEIKGTDHFRWIARMPSDRGSVVTDFVLWHWENFWPDATFMTNGNDHENPAYYNIIAQWSSYRGLCQR